MPNEIQTLTAQRDQYLTMVHKCTDAIKFLTGYTPDNFKFVFSIGSLPVVSIDIGEGEGNFCMSFFMSWHQYYSKKLKETVEIISRLQLDGDSVTTL